MPPAADPMWGKHAKETTKEEAKAGIMVTVKGWKCNHCSKSFWNKDLKRLLAHLSGDASVCTTAELCSEATMPISEETKAGCKAKLAMKAAKKTEKRAREAESASAQAADERERAENIQSRLKNKTVEACEVDGALSDVFDGLGLAHNKVDHKIFKTFFQKAREAPPDYKLPSRNTLSGPIMDQQHQANMDERSASLKHEGVRKFGLTGTTDGLRRRRVIVPARARAVSDWIDLRLGRDAGRGRRGRGEGWVGKGVRGVTECRLGCGFSRWRTLTSVSTKPMGETPAPIN